MGHGSEGRRRWRAIAERLEDSLPQVRGVPVVAMSALTGDGIDRLMRAVGEAYRAWNKRLRPARSTAGSAELTTRHAAPAAVAAGRLRLRYITQVKARPPTFALFVNRPDDAAGNLSALSRQRAARGVRPAGVPIRIMLRRGKNPYDTRKD